ncbi:MAG: lamin tail domain-containing protein [Patescibacteria group bacterium]|nr:lamin tail domain-containing protein [Patescibacteria group bacterium]
MKNITFIFVLLSASAVGFFAWADSAQAADSNLIITEVMYDPVKNSSGEKINWIELYNPTNQNIDLVPGQRSKTAPISWKMKIKYIDKLGILKENNCTFTDAKTASLTPNEFLIISTKPESLSLDESIKTFKASSCFALSGDYQETTIALSNNYGQHWFAETTYSPSQGENYLGKSLEKKILADENSWEPSCKDGGTPGEEPKICETETVSADEDSNATDSDGDTANSPEKCATSSKDIKLNELFPYPETGGQEFVELKNLGAYCVDLSDWKIIDEKENKYVFAPGTIIGPGEIWHTFGNFYLNNTSAETVYLLDSSEKEVDRTSYEKAVKKYSFSSDGQKFFWTSIPTPGAENIFDAAEDEETKDNSGTSSETESTTTNEKIYLNEILPNPKNGSDGEYIEIASGESGPVDLYGWRIKDASKSKGYQFKEHIVLDSGEYFAIYRSETKIVLNNSNESVNLYSPQGEVASSAAFDKSQKNASFNFDGENWKWSKYLTPGKKNKFDSEPSVKIRKPKNAFKDIPVEFSAKAKDKETKKLKYVWDFGDGKKSYLAKISHKYLATGKYTVTLSVSDDSQTIEKSFILAVKNYPRPDLEMVKIIPNPVGNDSDGEIVEIRNNSGKKVSLDGWKVATGSDDKIYNHPISGEIGLEPNEIKTITREFSKFSLNNKSGKIQLVMPDGKVADVVEYQKEKIAEDEAFAKIEGKWQWISSPNNLPGKEKSPEEEDSSKINEEEINSNENKREILGATDEKQPYYAPLSVGYSSEDEYIFFKLFGLLEYKPREADFCPAIQPANTLAYF